MAVSRPIAYSDCLEVRETHWGTFTVKYSNANDFADLNYSGEEPPIFTVRIKAMFFREKYPEENESESLSDRSVVKISGDFKTQKLIEMEPCPYYFHKLMNFVLQHNTIQMFDKYWEKEEAYEMNLINHRSPFERGFAWMTQKEESYYTNVYGEITAR